MKKHVQEWLSIAKKDWNSIEILLRSNDPDTAHLICFAAQQCIEKLIKGLLVQKEINPPSTHNLIKLEALLKQYYQIPNLNDLDELSVWAVNSRYPGVEPTWRHACSAAKSCHYIREILLPFYTE